MRRLLALALLALCVLAAPVVGAGPAAACSCGTLSDDGNLAASDAVFAGEVTGVELKQSPLGPGHGVTIWSFTVTRVFKAQVGPTVRIVSPDNPGACGLEIPQSGPALVFARSITSPARRPYDEIVLTANLCGGTRSLAESTVPASFGLGAEPDDAGLLKGIPVAPAPQLAAPAQAQAPAQAPAERTAAGGAPWWLVSVVAVTAAVSGALAGATIGRRRGERPAAAAYPSPDDAPPPARQPPP